MSLRRQAANNWVPEKRTNRTVLYSLVPDYDLVVRLRSWSNEKARDHSVPVHRIMDEPTLLLLARIRPRTLDELRGIPSLRLKTFTTYGEALLELLASSSDSLK